MKQEELKEIIENFTQRITDQNLNEWEVIEVSYLKQLYDDWNTRTEQANEVSEKECVNCIEYAQAIHSAMYGMCLKSERRKTVDFNSTCDEFKPTQQKPENVCSVCFGEGILKDHGINTTCHQCNGKGLEPVKPEIYGVSENNPPQNSEFTSPPLKSVETEVNEVGEAFEEWYKRTYDPNGYLFPEKLLDNTSFMDICDRVDLFLQSTTEMYWDRFGIRVVKENVLSKADELYELFRGYQFYPFEKSEKDLYNKIIEWLRGQVGEDKK